MGTRRKLGWVAVLYFAEGLPFGLIVDNLPIYFRLHGVSLAAIGLMSLVRAPWWAKVFWSPLVDQVGERRFWIVGALAVMAAALLAVGALPPAPVGTALIAALLLFTIAAATQDIAVDAYTIELLAPGEEGVANGVRVSAYRAALIFAGGVLVALAGVSGWPFTFSAAAVTLLVLALVAWRLPSVAHRPQRPREWADSLRAWLLRPGAIQVFLFVLLYKLDTNAIGPMVRPFWVDRGFPIEEIALVTTTFGIAASVAGALVGGVLTSRWGIFRALWVLGLFQAVANLGYALAAWTDAGRPGIYAASLGESFGAGLGTAAFLAFLMNICDKSQAATQYALLSALFNLSGSLAGAVSGIGATRLGYAPYFAFTFLLAL
ncbi:MAG TPA: MFS transporter, partial [Candidatus Binatia bacterium]|nr:MFS transporter [Candidatus Binatia bacterium]